ncbi:MAG: class I SAM-dependent methyltransferase [Candidatus Vogelbacteria bacterium]|nr:class I SAM-dependent methyltransferase [Candidatus Vogelbacteria bacterium]
MTIAEKWIEYEILDTGDGQKLERWGKSGDGFILSRPDPQVIWPKEKPKLWDTADAVYVRGDKGGGGKWKFITETKMPERWIVNYENLKFLIKPTGFKHTGIFPEQAPSWEWLTNKIRTEKRESNILNLFAYTGGGTVAALSAGAKVCHVDASNGTVDWAKENLKINGMENEPIRFIVDDALKFVEREKRRGSKYDGIIMDPPSFGRGSRGETWKIEKDLSPLVEGCVAILSNNPLFFIINSYTTGLSAQVMVNVLDSAINNLGGKIHAEDLYLPIKASRKLLPAGSTVRWEK